jgi:CRISPR-associated protein Csd1
MGWLSELNAVYDRMMKEKKNGEKPLPLYHIKNNAPLEIILDGAGKFCTARLLGKNEKADWQTCMPCTEKSAARTSGVEAYPWCDKLEYVAGDYADYAEGKNLREKHDEYLSLLEQWAQSEYSNEKIRSVYKYVKRGTLCKDLIKKGTIPAMSTSAGIGEKENNVFIRWVVKISDEEFQTWKDPEMHRFWIAFYSHTFLTGKGFCYVTGKNGPIAELHPAKIRNAGDSAKLISSNDASNYTFRGRFTEANQACQVGAEVSVKAHNALRWLIEKQGAVVGNGLTMVAWCAASDVEPGLLKNTVSLKSVNALGDEDEDDDDRYSILEHSANVIKRRLQGYYGKIKDNDKILIMGLNAASPGRMSLLLYREFSKSDFFEAQEFWHEHLAWFYTYWKKEEKAFHTVSAPSPEEIALTAYGKLQKKKLSLQDNVKAMIVQRLLPCIIDRAAIPPDIEGLCFNRAVRPETLGKTDRKKMLETACAVIKYNVYFRRKEEYKVGLEKDRRNRDYLYGRLLAVADRVEARVLYQRKEERDTNAVRYMQRFSKYPCSTWNLLYTEKLRPYFSQLGKKGHWYDALIQEIKDLFDHDEFVSTKALSGEFLLGYHCQQKAFWDGIAKAKTKTAEEPEPTDEEDK